MNDPLKSAIPTIYPKIPIDHATQRAVVDQWRASGMSLRAFALVHGVNERRLSRWCHGSKSPKSDTSPTASGFVEVRVERSVATVIEVVTGGGQLVRVRSGFDPVLLRAVVKALE